MQQFYKDGMVWLLHDVCSASSSIALLRATQWLYSQVAPSTSATVCTMDQGTWLGKALGALHVSSAGRIPQALGSIHSNTSPTTH